MLDFAYIGHYVLRKKARPIERIDESILVLIEQIKQLAAIHDNAAAIAAPQVGASIRLVVIYPLIPDPVARRMRRGEPKVYINPELTDPSDETDVEDEGCMSLPKLYAPVQRPIAITVSYQDETGAHHTERLKGFPARAIMHENDHLNGVLFIDRLAPKDKKRFAKEIEWLKKHYKKHNERLKLWNPEGA